MKTVVLDLMKLTGKLSWSRWQTWNTFSFGQHMESQHKLLGKLWLSINIYIQVINLFFKILSKKLITISASIFSSRIKDVGLATGVSNGGK